MKHDKDYTVGDQARIQDSHISLSGKLGLVGVGDIEAVYSDGAGRLWRRSLLGEGTMICVLDLRFDKDG